MKIDPIWDSVSTAVGIASGGIGLIGTGFKKAFISEDSSLGEQILVGGLATLLSGPFGLASYLIASPGHEAASDCQNVRGEVANRRYGC